MDHFITKYDTGQIPGAECAALEDTIMHKGKPVTAGSKILEGFISPIEATVVTRLETAGIVIAGKTGMDEFGVSGLFAGSIAKAAADINTAAAVADSAASHSSGMPVTNCAVAAVAEGAASFALCNDFTGAIRRQAAQRGLCYVHPTYGTVSRYGLIPAVQSMDQIGIVCRNADEGFRVLSIIAGHDPKDGAMFPDANTGKLNRDTSIVHSSSADCDVPMQIGIPVNVLSAFCDKPSADAVRSLAGQFGTVEFELEYFDVYEQIMQILCCAEISSNLCRYDGIKFGYRAAEYIDLNELYTKSRTQAFGPDVKLASITGAMALSHGNYGKYYDKAMRVRRLIRASLDFGRYDVIIMPVDSGESALAMNALPQLCGLPAVTLPYNGAGVTLIAAARQEKVIERILKALKEVSQ